MAHVFISYVTENSKLAAWVASQLRANVRPSKTVSSAHSSLNLGNRPMLIRSTLLLVGLASAWGTEAIAAKDPLFCSPERKEICNYNKPCEVVSAGDFLVIIDDANNLYTRCDKPDRKTCDSYNMVKSGDYKRYQTFEMSGRGGFSKLGPDGDWAEAVSLGGMIVVSHGMCFRESALKK